jgi:glutamyl/glutaminyl-tRNA synthetase
MQEILQWAGLNWDEGPATSSSSSSSSSGPYIQSQRLDIYKHYSEDLIKRGKAYRDFRTQQEEDPDAEVARKAVARGNLKRSADEIKRDNERARAAAKKGVQQYVPPDEEQAQRLIKSGKGYCVRLRVSKQWFYRVSQRTSLI